jgi:hypothetical protein
MTSSREVIGYGRAPDPGPSALTGSQIEVPRDYPLGVPPARRTPGSPAPPPGGALQHGLVGHAGLAALLDSAAYARAALGQESDVERVRREVQLALASAGSATGGELARALERDDETVRRALVALRKDACARSFPDPRDGRARRYQVTRPTGVCGALSEAGQATGGAALHEGVRALTPVQPGKDTTHQTPAPQPGHGKGAHAPRPFLGASPLPAVPGSPEQRTAARLKLQRHNAGWRQPDLANAAGLSLRDVQRLESGWQLQSVHALLACRALGARLVDVVAPGNQAAAHGAASSAAALPGRAAIA